MPRRYYWLKLKEDFFEEETIKLLENMENGKDYIIFLLKLRLKTINTKGHLKFKGKMPYNEKMLATITGTNIDIVRQALNVFRDLALTNRLDDGTIYMEQIENIVGSESESAERVRRHRENLQEIPENPLLSNVDVTNSNTDIDTELDLESDKEKEKNNTTAVTNTFNKDLPASDGNVTSPVTLHNGTDIELELDLELDKEKNSTTAVSNTPYKEIIEYLNESADRDYNYAAKQNQKLIKARWNEGYSLDDFKKVIDNKVDEWKDSAEMDKYLRPATLFAGKFDTYLNQRPKKKNDLGVTN